MFVLLVGANLHARVGVSPGSMMFMHSLMENSHFVLNVLSRRELVQGELFLRKEK
jgi:hypothetical protein